MVKSPLAFLQIQREMLLGDAVEPAQMTLGLIPEILDAVDVIVPVSKQLTMVDPIVMEIGYVQGIVAAE